MGGRVKSKPIDAWKYVDKKNPDECWPWNGPREPKGYGTFNMNYKGYRAHRVIYSLCFPDSVELSVGRCTSGNSLLVLHKCDNPPCCNPNHLFLGKNADNLKDMYAKGRKSKNHGGALAKLGIEDVDRIREACLFGAKKKDLAAIYDVSNSTISYANSGRNYAHV